MAKLNAYTTAADAVQQRLDGQARRRRPPAAALVSARSPQPACLR